MALAQHFIANNGFNSVKIPLPTNALADSTLLEKEAFPGELASLRAQLSQNKSTPNEVNPQKKTHPGLNFLQQKNRHSNYTEMADQLIEMMPTGLVMLDGNGVVVKINKVARALLDEPILGQPWFSVIARSFKPRADDWHEVSLKDGRRVKLEIASLGEQPGQLIMITDLTETRLLQDKVGQMQRLSSLGRMVSTLAHQIRTPLSAAMLYSANLLNKSISDESRVSFQEKLSSRLHDLEQQVNDMLLFSKSGNEQVVKSLSVNELINDATQSMDALIIKANAKLNIHLPDNDHFILANKNALTGAIQNLIHNSLQATDANKVKQPVINIQIYSQHNTVYISVKDNGAGINTKHIDKIFEPFYTSSHKGTGLGLAVVKSVMEAHQGKVNYLSKPGEGAHFCLKLPLLNKASETQYESVQNINQQEKSHESS
ncbi:ATP-binding protein [Colwellia sp. 4_MG-2023]|uniref:sensor histidine kinase n=1 Tax=unclassified Colwellia TaxID=196834 RepID=UPI0026E38E43|nr:MULTISPECIES: ATP-binding protein [unclassified Colwellia]MDO6506960.1 ATP-binding protein [Colwellia sp. 5_MG-2023]MDO6556602.1 ATP-binding protein [Colwellia sp. 4_MG-2023]